MVEKNVGQLDANVRRFLAVPAIVVAATGGIAYHAYGVALGALLVGAWMFATGSARFCPVYRALGLKTQYAL